MLLAGIALLDLFGGIGSMLLSVLQAGFRVNHYFYCDHCVHAAAVVRNNIMELCQRFPHLITPAAFTHLP